jgi:hypothetical protein
MRNIIFIPLNRTRCLLFCLLSVAWSEWTHWSACSIEPCHSNGIQTRHRTCQADSLPVAEQTCLDQREGSSAETRPCQCPTQTTQTTSEELLKATTETFVRPSGQFLQPQRTFSLQVPQNRPIQRRPTTKLPGTCSAFEKPCNNGQCILSYRICTYLDQPDGQTQGFLPTSPKKLGIFFEFLKKLKN